MATQTKSEKYIIRNENVLTYLQKEEKEKFDLIELHLHIILANHMKQKPL